MIIVLVCCHWDSHQTNGNNPLVFLFFHQKKSAYKADFYSWVGDGIRTHDPRNHNPVL